jgi:hypothetical protein
MELKRHPETELEYWAIIEELGGFIFYLNHDLADGRIQSTPEMEKDIVDARKISKQLVGELRAKFGVVAPEDCPKREYGKKMPDPPSGLKWYWVWYEEMKEKAHKESYNGMICSACPLSEGVEKYISLGNVPCGVWSGMIYQLVQPFLCAMARSRIWTEKQLLEKIFEKGGQDAVTAFNNKRRELIGVYLKNKNGEAGCQPPDDEIDDLVKQMLSQM